MVICMHARRAGIDFRRGVGWDLLVVHFGGRVCDFEGERKVRISYGFLFKLNNEGMECDVKCEMCSDVAEFLLIDRKVVVVGIGLGIRRRDVGVKIR